jgi:regulator of sirC expression with transglutaminase-like and TPR domain
MEENLAREMARMKMEREKQQREIEKICSESNELKELQSKIKAAYLNKERASQVTENQFRK